MQYRNAISSMQTMLDILTGLRKIREYIPVREAVSGVVNDRRELVRGCLPLGPTSVCLMHGSVIGILCMHLAVCLRTRFPGTPAAAAVPPFCPARA
jgi:hypothetical protein